MASIVSDEYELLVDSKYRSYVSAVDKALKYFENTSEWPDLISALGKLNKVLLSNMKYVVIPRRIVVSKRLAQCMHPALPSGVHLKALETYDIIFKCIGTDRLSQELFIYSAGLFPLLGNAAMNVRPSLLSIYENHFVPLGIRLRPGLPGFLTGVLPGLEEGSEYSNRITELLDNVCKCVEAVYFYGCLWECLLANPTVRLPAVNFVLGHFNRKLSMEDQLHIMGTNVDITVHALCSSVQDSNVLVQRSTLDFLILAFPMHSEHLLRDDVERILTAAVVVVLRRDMSLNRRLYSWLLGADNVSASAPRSPPASSGGHATSSEDYLRDHSKTILVSAIKACLQSANTGVVMDTLGGSQPLLWPYRLLISLLDKPEIASAILDDVIIEVFRALYQACCSTRANGKKTTEPKNGVLSGAAAAKLVAKHSSPTKQRDEKLYGELVKTANLLFAMVEPSYIWDSLGSQFEAACGAKAADRDRETFPGDGTVRSIGGGESTVLEICELVDFLLELVAIETSTETQTKHLPSLIRKISANVTAHCRRFTIAELTQSFRVCWRLLSKTEVATVPLVPAAKKPSAAVGPRNSAPFRFEDTTQRPDIYLRNCVHSFQKCFLEVFSARLLCNGCDWRGFLARIDEGKRDTREEWDEKLDQLLCGAVESEQTYSLWDSNAQRKVARQKQSKNSDKKWTSLLVASDYGGLLQAFSHACQILVDFSSFPVCFVAGGNCTPCSPSPPPPLTKFGMTDVPSWFRFLLAVCCCFPDLDFQLVAIGTVLELMALAQPTLKVGVDRVVDQTGSVEEAAAPTFSVVMNAILKAEHVRFVHRNTTFFQTVANLLWDNLGSSGQQCVNLLLHLHSLSPSASIVEDVIGKAMSNEDEVVQAKAVRKFAVLWYLARDIIPKLASPYGRVRMLDRSLLEMLNRLQRPCGPQGSEVLSWLTHALQRGDVGSILEPVLFILLHPDTARVSVQHVKIGRTTTSAAGREPDGGTCASREASTAEEARIYAISSVEGHVVYHVSNKGSTTTGSAARRPGSLHVPKKVFAISSLGDGGGSSAKSSERPTIATSQWDRDYDMPTSLENAIRHPISLFVNPFGNIDSTGVQSGCESEKTVDISAAHRMGASFDDADEVSQGSAGEEDSSSTDQASSVEVVTSILDEVVDQVVANDNADCVILVDKPNGKEDYAAEDKDQSMPRDVSVHPMHTYLLLYTQCYDAERVLYALSTLRAVVGANPRLAVKALATAGVAGSRSPRQSRLFELLARHRKSIFGRNFEGELGSEATSGLRSSMYLEIVISLCLYFTRSLYPNLRHIRLTEREVSLNREVQLLAIDVLTLLLAEVASVVRDSGRGFASYVVSLLDKCKVQKTILHCALAGVQTASAPAAKDPATFTEAIVSFNDAGEYGETFHVGIVRLLLVLVVLEDQLAGQGAAVDQEAARIGAESPTFPNPPKAPGGNNCARYQPGVPICSQPMFLSALLSALKQQRRSHLHHHWLGLANSALPFLKKALPSVVVPVVTQLCRNLESLASCYVSDCPFGGSKTTGVQESSVDGKLPVDHVVIQLEGLTTVVHYCLLDSSVTNASNSLVTTVASQPNSSIATQGLVSGPSASQILNNLINVFVPVIREAQGTADGILADPLMTTRRTLLSNLPRIVSSLVTTWELVSRSQSSAPSGHPSWIMGSPKVVRQHILELLSPLSHHHGINFLAAVAITWNDKRSKPNSLKGKEVVPKCSLEQAVLVELVASIKVMPVDTFVQLVRQVVRQPPPTTSKSKKMPLEVSLLQLFYSYVCTMSGSHLVEAWSSLLALLKDGLQLNLSPPCLFLLLGTLNEFVQRTPLLEDKKDQRDLQDIAQRLVEVCTTIAGAGLEQTTWLRRNMAVKPGPQAHPDDNDQDLERTTLASSDAPVISVSEAATLPSTTGNVKYSVQALSILAEILAQLLDVSFVSDEKEKVVPVLSALMYTVTPYLRNHSGHNVPSFRACSQLLANLSGYRYTRKAWRKDVFELLLDPAFFQMDIHCLRSWKITIDNLMTHDKATFHDLLGRVIMPQAGTLNLFSSKEQEYELRAQLLKRLAFVLFCSEVDQYQSSLPDIQERLSEGLRLQQVPALQAQVFLCFYVLLLRMSPHHITSLWPVIITEMVQVFLQIEQELCKESEEFSSHLQRLSTLDSSWVTSSSNGLNAHSHPAWLQLYLAVCRLLDLAVALPADRLPQFQMYRWAFVGDPSAHVPANGEDANGDSALDNGQVPDFVPHVVRILRLMDAKAPCNERLTTVPGRPLLTLTRIHTLMDLHPFFQTLTSRSMHVADVHASARDGAKVRCPSYAEEGAGTPTSPASDPVDDPMAFIEFTLEFTFLEPLSSSTVQ